jgi:superfamily II DNA or RNA helicase
LGDLLKESEEKNQKQQIMILAHNKSLLKYLYDAVEHRKIAEGSVGYYVGGMKEAALKETETKRVVIATYAMAAEALDIKTLSTLIMATPKTDIEQSVGRILREKHKQPIVVDIIDSHEPFQNQWRKRKQFYKKENYKVTYTTNDKYLRDKLLGNIINTCKSNVNKEPNYEEEEQSLSQDKNICLIPSIKKST